MTAVLWTIAILASVLVVWVILSFSDSGRGGQHKYNHDGSDPYFFSPKDEPRCDNCGVSEDLVEMLNINLSTGGETPAPPLCRTCEDMIHGGPH